MLDDMGVLRESVEAYRKAATAAGVSWHDWADGADNRSNRLPPDALCRLFDVDRIPEQPLWLAASALPYERVLPAGAHLLPWTNGEELLGLLGMSVAIPFDWRHQLPLFFIDHLLFTFVLTGENEGEIWRYQIDPEDWNPMRAASSLAAMFDEWTKGFTAGIYDRSQYDNWLHIGYGGGDPVGRLLEGDLDPLAFPVYISQYGQEELIRARQRECGVDIDRADDPDALEELQDAVDAVRKSLRA